MPEQVGFLVGRNIAKARENAGLTQQQLAEKIGRMRHEISRFETGERIPRIEVLAKIAETLQVNIKVFFEDENQNT